MSFPSTLLEDGKNLNSQNIIEYSEEKQNVEEKDLWDQTSLRSDINKSMRSLKLRKLFINEEEKTSEKNKIKFPSPS